MQRSTRKPQSDPSVIVPNSFMFWCAAGVMGYSLLIPLLAIDSLVLAETALKFRPLHQVAIILVLILEAISLLGKIIVRGWRWGLLPGLIGLCLLLLSIQPECQGCAGLAAAVAGALPFSELRVTDVIMHLMPVAGCIPSIVRVSSGGFDW